METVIHIDNIENLAGVFGSFDENLRLIENEYDVHIVNRSTELKIMGEESAALRAEKVIEGLTELYERGEAITEQTVRYVAGLVNDGFSDRIPELGADCVCITAKGKPVKAKTLGQKQYIEAIRKNTVVMAVGPAGTGKTYLAVAMAVSAMRQKQISRIILTRPAIEAGEKLGFLPGDLQSKIDPYLRPLHDALFDMLGVETYQKFIERNSIEVAPLAYMRGRTLDDSFIILDEAQNTTPQQMKMFLTRIGFGSKAVITGDITQIDLPYGTSSGLKEAVKVLKDIDGIKTVTLSEKDVVRHQLVQKIIKAYEKYDRDRQRHSTVRYKKKLNG